MRKYEESATKKITATGWVRILTAENVYLFLNKPNLFISEVKTELLRCFLESRFQA